MTRPVWTILIATLGYRGPKLERLLASLLPQVEAASGAVTVEALWNNAERPVGDIRQDLLEHASADYICFVDDDDELPPYYVERVLPLLDGKVDYIGWQMRCFADGFPLPPTYHSLRYSSWHEDDDGYYRDVSHLNPVRRDLTAGTTFRKGWPEDVTWAEQMRGRLVTEAYIDEEMYFYCFAPGDSVMHGLARSQREIPERPGIHSPYFSWHPASSPDLVAEQKRRLDTWDWCGPRVRDMVTSGHPVSAEILDVGACWGKYRILLPEYPAMDACEAWEPYVTAEDLASLYRHVYVTDICDLVASPQWHAYDVVIMGDVFEHIARPRAKAMLDKVLDTCGDVIVVVPYLYEQGPEHGNHYQCHLQADLTPELMAAEYPALTLCDTEYRDGRPFKGLYARRGRLGTR